MISPDVNPTAVMQAVTETWRRLKDERSEKENIWQECELAYNSKHGKGYNQLAPFRSRRYLPMSFEAVENVSSHLTKGIMPHDDWFKIEGRTPDDDKAAKYMTALLKWQHYRTGFRSEVAKILKTACIFGVAPWSVEWKQDYIYKPDMGAHADQMAQFMAQQHVGMDPGAPPAPPMTLGRIYDGPCLKSISPYDYVQERRHLDLGYPVRIVRMLVSKAYLEQESIPNAFGWQKYENIEDVFEMSSYAEASDSLKQRMDAIKGIGDIPVGTVELLCAYGDIPLRGDGENAVLRNHVCVVANRSTLIRCEPNPYAHGKSPWNMLGLIPDPTSIYSKGVLESALGIQDVANVRMNQIIEANSLANSPQFVAVQDGVFDVDDFISAPGAVHLVGQQGNLQQIPIRPNVEQGFSELGFMKAEFNEATNAMKAFTTADYQKSATEVSALKNMMDSRFSELIRHLETTFVFPILQMQCDLNQQYMDEATWVRVVEPAQEPAVDPMGQPMPVPKYEPVGPAPMRIAPEDIQGDLDIYPVGAQWIANQQTEVAQLIQWGQMMGAIPQAQIVVDWAEYGRVGAEKMQLRDTWRFIKSPQRIAYEQYQQFLASQAAQGQPGPGGPAQGGGSGPGGGEGGGGGVASMAGTPSTPPPPAAPGAQPSAGGPQTI
jgi:hypothetical protein